MKRFALLFVACIALIASGAAVAQTPAADTVVTIAETPELGQFLADAEGMTLYIFTNDEPGVSNCDGDCAANWPPFVADDISSLPEGFMGELTMITRSDGTEQVAYNGWPLYYWVQDTAPGDTTGHEVGDVWFVAEAGVGGTPEASPVASPVAAGDAAVMVAETPELGQFLADAEGMTLYIFTNDEVDSGISVCNGDCAVNWPPFYAEGATLPEGVAGELTVITRDDGSEQLAYNGLPLYYWVQDMAPGDTTGHEVGDVWFVAEVGE